MHSPALALNWQIWGRHRYGLAAALCIVAGICVTPQAYPAGKLTSDVGDSAVPFMMAQLMPFGFVMVFFAYAFSHAEQGIRVRSSGFPLWMLTLPVRTPLLVLWPMLTGALTMIAVWIAVGWFALNKVGLEVPLVWPALGLACTLVWIQAVDWSPLGSISKAVVAGAVLAGLWTGLLRDDTQNATALASPGILLLGYVAGVAGVSRVRRGGRTVGGTFRIALAPRFSWRLGRRRAFTSPQQAQLWLEHTRNGKLLPVLAACWAVFGTILVWMTEGRAAGQFMASGLMLSIGLAPLVGILLGKPDVWSRQLRLPTFAAGRALTCGDVVVAKLRMAARSLLIAWLILAAASLLWLIWEWQRQGLPPFWEHVLPDELRAFYLQFACGALAAFGFTLLLMAGTFVVSMTGRLWIVMAALFFYLGGVPNLMAMDVFRPLTDLSAERLLWVLSGAIVVKLALAGWVFWRRYQLKHFTGRAIAGIVAVWLATVIAIYGMVAAEYSISRAADMPWTGVAWGVLLCPLFLIALAPLGLAWNRHR